MAKRSILAVHTPPAETSLTMDENNIPLLESFKRYAAVRNAFLTHQGRAQIEFPLSTKGWAATIFTIRGRALDRIVVPWIATVLHSIIYTILQETIFEAEERNIDHWDIFFGLVLNSTLSFLLVFRLNRAAGRYWLARTLWGDLVAHTRTLVGGVIVHGEHNVAVRDEVLRWVAAYPVCTMEFMRLKNGNDPMIIPAESLRGIISQDELLQVQNNPHPPLYVADRIRYNIRKLFNVTNDTSAAMGYQYTAEKESLERLLNLVMNCCGGMERIKTTPLPMVYVSHLRTFLLLALLLFPYVWGPFWHWGTIPVVATAAFALLGIEGTASEVEMPFALDRVNSLNMDTYCKGVLSTIQQQLQNQYDRIQAEDSISIV